MLKFLLWCVLLVLCWPLALLVAVEMMPDIMRTIGNVTMDTALAAAVDRRSGRSKKRLPMQP